MKKGMVDLVLLNEIRSGGVSGVDLTADLEGLFTPGTIYPALTRLERGGFVKASRRRAATGRTRKEYELTAAGLEELARLSATWDSLKAAVDRLRAVGNG